MNRYGWIGAGCALVTVASLLAIWSTPAPKPGAALSGAQETLSRLSVELSGLRQMPSAPLPGVESRLRAAEGDVNQVAGAFNVARDTLRRAPSFPSWGPGQGLAALDATEQSVLRLRATTYESANAVAATQLLLADYGVRVTRVEAGLQELNAKVQQAGAAAEAAAWRTIWLPLCALVISSLGGISAMMLGWRRERRELLAERARERAEARAHPAPDTSADRD